MRIPLQLQEQEIVDRIVLRLSSNSNAEHLQNYIVPEALDLRRHRPPQKLPSETLMMELESQLAQLRVQEAHEQRICHAPEALGRYNPTRDLVATIGESIYNKVESVEILFPGMERKTLV